jgi:hypothetical protein
MTPEKIEMDAPCVLPRNDHRTPATSGIPPNPPSHNRHVIVSRRVAC